jgi:predicted phosphodiesterase
MPKAFQLSSEIKVSALTMVPCARLYPALFKLLCKVSLLPNNGSMAPKVNFQCVKKLFLQFSCFIIFYALFSLSHYQICKAQVFSRYPSIQLVSQRTVVCSWKTPFPTFGQVRVIFNSDTLIFSDCKKDTIHAVYLTDLPVGKYLKYQVLVDGIVVDDEGFRFRIPTAQDSTFTFAIFGDTGDGSQAQLKVRDQILSYLVDNKLDFILHTGDVVYPNGEPWLYDLRYFKVYQQIIKGVFVFLTPGNHDYYYDGSGSGYYSAFFLPQNSVRNTEEFYTFSWGNAFFISLNITGFVSFLPGSDQYLWLERQLSSFEAQSSTWRIVFFHIPPFSTTKWYNTDIERYLLPLFKKYSVQIVFCGHVHGYEVGFKDGVYFITSGGGGAYLHSSDFQSERPEILRYKFVHHFCVAHVNGNKLVIKAIDTNGSVFDSLEVNALQSVSTDKQKTFASDVQLEVYPNPSLSYVNLALKVDDSSATSFLIDIVDVFGRRLKTFKVTEFNNPTIIRWDGKSERGFQLSSGVYFCFVYDSHRKVRLVKRIILLK